MSSKGKESDILVDAEVKPPISGIEAAQKVREQADIDWSGGPVVHVVVDN